MRLIESELRDRKGPGAAAYHRPVRRRGSSVASDLNLDSSLPGTGLRDPNGVPQPFPIVLPLVLNQPLLANDRHVKRGLLAG